MNNTDNFDNNDIDLNELISYCWSKKNLFLSITATFVILSGIYSYYLPDIYRSEAILAPADEGNSMSKTLQGYGGLASLAGIDLPSANQGSMSLEAIEKLTSFKFFETSILPNIYLPDLMAIKEWNLKENTTSYDKRKYDSKELKWIRKAKFPKKVIPSAQEAYKEFEDIFYLNQDDETGFIYIAVEHQSPFIAKEWTELMINNINSQYRVDHKKEATLSIDYLTLEIAKAKLAEVRQALAKLVQNEAQKSVLIESNEEYVFKILDPPYVPEEKTKPLRFVIIMLGFLLGSMISVSFLTIKFLINRK